MVNWDGIKIEIVRWADSLPFSSSWAEIIAMLIAFAAFILVIWYRKQDKHHQRQNRINSVIDNFMNLQLDKSGCHSDCIGLKHAGIAKLEDKNDIHSVIDELLRRKMLSTNVETIKENLFKLKYNEIVYFFDTVTEHDLGYMERIISQAPGKVRQNIITSNQ